MDDSQPTTDVKLTQWVVTRETYVKTEPQPADTLADHNKHLVPVGAVITAELKVKHQMWLIMRNVSIDGKALRDTRWLIHSEHCSIAAPQAADMQATTNLADLITEEELIRRKWRFGAENDSAAPALYFLGTGKISGIESTRERFWSLDQGELKIFDQAGKVSWKFQHGLSKNGAVKLKAVPQLPHPGAPHFLSEITASDLNKKPVKVAAEEAAPATQSGAPESIKLIIWDLDDTFWSGTLAEGGITPIQANIDFVKEMAQRGIINSISSKNEFERTKQELIKLGVWDYFIFPKIAFLPKGAMIKDVIESCQLRTPSVLFIDDNPININEALHYNPGLQVCMPDAIPTLLKDPRCEGKPDPEMKRLERYKVLEKKSSDQATQSDNLDFLRQSEIRVSFHHDIEAEFPRIHDLVNRTNQLNFTKNRWPEDEAAAKETFKTETAKFASHFGYVKVSDRYGGYGICGFYLTIDGRCRHYLFSCRTLNMGIEQFVWQKIGRPPLKITGEVVASLGDSPDWITVVDDADAETSLDQTAEKPVICVRGACDLATMTHYLRTRYEMIEEFPFPYLGWRIQPTARAIAVYEETQTEAGRALIERIPGIPPRRFESAIHKGSADVYILSYSQEVSPGLYRSRSTGMLIPFETEYMRATHFDTVPFEKIAEKANRHGLQEAEWEFMQKEFEYISFIDPVQMSADVRRTFEKLAGKTVIVLLLNTKIGNNNVVLRMFDRINTVTRPLIKEFGFHHIDLQEFIRDENDLIAPTDSGAHFNRDVYRKLAAKVNEILTADKAGSKANVESIAAE